MNLYFCDQLGKISLLSSNDLVYIMDNLISSLYTATSGEVLAILNMSVVQHSQPALEKPFCLYFFSWIQTSSDWWCFDWIIINRRSVYFCRNSFSVFLLSNRPCRQTLTSLTICLGVFSQLIAYCAMTITWLPLIPSNCLLNLTLLDSDNWFNRYGLDCSPDFCWWLITVGRVMLWSSLWHWMRSKWGPMAHCFLWEGKTEHRSTSQWLL